MPLGFVSFAIMVGVASAGSLVEVSKRVRERRRAHRRISDVPGAHVGIADGTVVRVTGTVRVVDDELVAPLSGRTCVLYRTRTSVGQPRTLGYDRF